ncbi:MAG TPA: hypothetical protein VFU02_05040 [Polyangiaceae bacterium]|nr:hypothetical protein [Polyangiaceae bacterium]
MIPQAEALAGGNLSLALAGIYQHQPLRLEAPSPDGAGREVSLVEHVVDTQALFAAGLGSGFELTSALRLVAYQEGSGIGAARSRASSDPSLATSAVRDPLFGIAYTLVAPHLPTRRHSLKLRSDFSLPLGDSQSFASEPGGVVAPAVTFQWQAGRFSIAGDVGLRLRPSATLADVRYGNQLSVASGLAVEVLTDMLSIAAEATALPGIGSQPTTPDSAETRWIPAEWALTVSFFCGEVYSLLASAGGGLPLSSRSGGTENSGFDSGSFVGLGAPRVRSLLVLRVTSPRND